MAQSGLHIEEKGIAPVTPAEAHGRPATVFSLWIAANIEFATIVTGALATSVFGLSIQAAVCAILLANAIGAILLGAFSTFGLDHGLPQMIQGAAWFGRLGNKVPSLLNFVGGFSWFAVNTIAGAYALDHFVPIGLIPSVLVLSVVQIGIAFVGHDLIQAVEKYLLYVLVLLFGILTVFALQHVSLHIPANAKSMAAVGGFTGAFILTTSIMVGYIVSWVPYSSDYTRYLRQDPVQPARRRAVAGYAFWGALISCVWMEALGALIGSTVSLEKPSDLFTNWLPVWFRVPLLVGIIGGTISANILNIYSSTMSGLALGLRMKQHNASLLAGACGTVISVLAAANFITNYENFLFVLGYWIMPWIAIGLLSHYTARVSRFGVSAGFVAWVVTIVLCVPFYDQALYTGFFAKAHPEVGDITFAVSFILAGILYMLFTKPAAYTTRMVAAE